MLLLKRTAAKIDKKKSQSASGSVIFTKLLGMPKKPRQQFSKPAACDFPKNLAILVF